MRNFIFVTEGAHDVSFIGKLLLNRGFSRIKDYDNVPDEWKSLFPKKFPWNGNSIERVARFPDVFKKDQLIVGLINSGGDSLLVDSLRNALDMLVPETIECAVIFSDADCEPAQKRFQSLIKALKVVNSQAGAEKAPGYPISVPSCLGSLTDATPSVAIYVFPDNDGPGTLENILLECSRVSHPDLAEKASEFVNGMNGNFRPCHNSLKKMRKGSNLKKSIMGSIASVLKPGSSLAVAVEQQDIVPQREDVPKLVSDIDAFIEKCLQ